MKRTILIASVLFLAAAGTYFTFAQEEDNTIPPYTPPLDPNAVDGVPARHCPFCMMMGQSMLQSHVEPLAGGGVLIMMGNTLYKYDANLNLLNQVQIPIDPQQIQQQMQQLMQSCPFCSKNQRQGWQDGQTDGQTNGQTNGIGEEKTKTKAEKESKSQSKVGKEQS